MKRIYVLILALFYLFFINGVTVYQHYCMGELQSVSVIHERDSSCSKCGMKKHLTKNNGCCKDVTLSSKKSGDFHIYSSTLMYFNQPVTFTPSQYYKNTFVLYPQHIVKAVFIAHRPPLIKKQPLYLTYDDFRI